MEANNNQGLLTLIQMDAHYLVHKIEVRKDDYLHIFSAKRERSPLGEIFKSKFDLITPADLKQLPVSIIVAVENFYQTLDKLKWYLHYTDDMPFQVEETLLFKLPKLKKALGELEQSIAQYLDGKSIPEVPPEDLPDIF